MQIRYSILALCALGMAVGCSGARSSPTSTNGSANAVASNTSHATVPSVTPSSQSSEIPVKPGNGGSTPKAKTPAVKVISPSGDTGSAPGAAPAKPAPSISVPVAITKDTGWVKTDKSPVEVATEADQMIKSLNGVQVNIVYAMTSATGRTSGHLVEKLRNSSVYALQFPILVKDPQRGVVPALAWVKSTGPAVTTRVDKLVVSRPAGSKPAPAALEMVQHWPTNANREVFAGLMEKRMPFAEYMKALEDKKSGYSVKVEERKQPFEGKVVDEYMITAVRSPAAAKTLGASTIRVVMNAQLHLPVSIRAEVAPPGAPLSDSLKWDAQWVNHQKFSDQEFLFPQTQKGI